jgi:hypothetical protein
MFNREVNERGWLRGYNVKEKRYIPYFLEGETEVVLRIGKSLRLIPAICTEMPTRNKKIPSLFLAMTESGEKDLLSIYDDVFSGEMNLKRHESSEKSEGRGLNIIIERQRELLSRSVKKLFFEELKLLDHFEGIKRSFLGDGGGGGEPFLETFLLNLFGEGDFVTKVVLSFV